MKSLIGYIAVLIIRIMGLQSYSFAHKLGTLMGKMMYARRTRAREVARRNIAACLPELDAQQQEALVRKTLIEGGKTMTEIGLIWGWSIEKAKKLIKKTHGEEILDNAIAEGNGVLFMALHHGNWEILNHAFQGKVATTAMYKPAKMPPFDNWMYQSRARLGLNLVATNKEGVLELFNVLKRQQMVGFLPDQEPSRRSGEFAPFFGVPALTPKLPYELIQKTGCKVVFAFVERLANSEGFAVHYRAADEGIYSADLSTCLTSMNKTIEECVRTCPEQFEWSYKRFKRRPEGEKHIYGGVP